MTVEHGEPDRRLVAEGDRQRLLQMRPAGHGRVAVAPRQVGQDAAQGGDVVLDDAQAFADLKGDGRIHDVLGGRPPVHVAPRLAALFHELMHERQDRVADDVGFMPEKVEVERFGIRPARDLLGRALGDDAASRFGLRQGNLDLDVSGDQRQIREHLAHARRAERISKKDGIENRGGGWRCRTGHELPSGDEGAYSQYVPTY
jgi:hypothetical protein